MVTNPKICIGTLSNRGFKPKTVESLLNLRVPYEKFVVVATQGFHIAENRNYIATQALNNNCTHLFFVDDDMVFEPDILERLLAHDKDVVGVAYHPRNKVDKNTATPLDKVHIETLKENGIKELFECEGIGTGILLIKTDVFLNIARPWFYVQNHLNGATIQGEDWWFCNQVRKAGFKIWCDPTLSVGHIGDFVY